MLVMVLVSWLFVFSADQGAGRTLVRYITVIMARSQELSKPSMVFSCL